MIEVIKGLYKKYQLLDDQIDRAVKYLQYYQYIRDEFSLDDLGKALVNLQKQAGVSLSGELCPKTLNVMTLPRCGCKEQMVESATNMPKWGISTLNYFISGRDNDLSANDWDACIRDAFSSIEKICGLTFERVFELGRANLVLGVGQGRGDGFDGPSGVLAWFELPNSSNFRGRLNGKFDLGESWVYKSGRGIKLQNVSCHEILHGLGLSHSSDSSDLMAPFYSPDVVVPQSGDIAKLVARYGKPKPSDQVPPTPAQPIPQNPSCNEMLIKLNSGGVCGKIEIPGYRVSRIDA